MKIRKDADGLYVANARGPVYRPGGVPGFDHVYDMDDGSLKEGDNPKAAHVSQSPLLRIQLDDGRVLYWAPEDMVRSADLAGPELG